MLRPPRVCRRLVLAGPVANFVLALIIYCGIAWAQGQTYLLPEVGDVTPGTPAATAGIQPGDRVLSIDGKPIENWNAVAEGIGAGNGKPVTIVLSRGGSEVTLSLTPEAKTRANIFGEEKPAWLIGIRASTATGHLPLGPVEAIGAGFRQTWDMIAFTCESFVKLAQRVVPLDNVGGPILIAQMVRPAGRTGPFRRTAARGAHQRQPRHPQPAAHPDPRRRAIMPSLRLK